MFGSPEEKPVYRRQNSPRGFASTRRGCDWEQGRFQPDSVARAYIRVIARETEAVERALSE